ncbi:MAG: hypothetical protein OWR62_06190 [Sulfobacillus thermotolerans]|uniref:Uncharacterized protein n=1 Tax=Sulfobacillus thermotolerans TaxID=338644 RepID=A0ABN5H3E8_9FIRM|nr:hypothetical protein BXT84_08810 [Sulfobacillus thermotolerans]MCY0907956.1 hypothetical protein [Sulfobacillus thermotolerans]
MRLADPSALVKSSVLKGVLSWVAKTLDSTLIQVSHVVFMHVVFRPFQLSSTAMQVYGVSRSLAISASAAFLMWAIIQVQWPELRVGPWMSTPVITVHRAVTQALWAITAIPVVRLLLNLNNAVVRALDTPATSMGSPSFGSLGVVTDPVAAVLIFLAVLVLMVLLGVYYGVRSVEIVVLMALIPWFALVWMAHPGSLVLQKLTKELIVAIFIQSLHALMFYFFLHVTQGAGSTVPGQLAEIGILWYMLKLPQQLRRMVGAVGPGGVA